ncbi:TolB family protein [Micromonospora sp. NPDC000316]|uniref:TolB family protein n=1 Tax=Micromonospora sp. NPDC000316 TaxID=3364216 RepID=UPI003693DD7A
MTARLRDALRTAAADVPTYPVYERALATARRARRRSAIATVAALVLVALTGAILPLARTPAADPGASTDAALPDRIALPPIGTLHATDRPRLGPASVIFSGQAPRLQGWDEDGIVGVVSADSDRYRIFSMGYEAPVGEKVILSPDGRYIARPGGPPDDPRVDIIDLVAGGHTRRLDSKVADSVGTTPLAWSPDGKQLVVEDSVPTSPEGASYRQVLSIVTLDGERWTWLTDEAQQAIFGSPVAFAPGGSRLAYQVGRTVTVADPDGRKESSFLLPAESWLAGKGAWTTDGALTLVTRKAGTSDWSLRSVDPTTGRDTGPLPLPGVSGVTAIRLLGWGPGGSALVVAYQPEPLSPDRFDQPLEMDQRTAYPNVRRVRVLALTPDATAPRTMMTAPEQILAVDVADNVIHSGRTRDASPPDGVGARFWFWTILITVLITGIAAYRTREQLALWLDDRRVKRARRQET